ncbi:MAG: amidohydrolase family protein [Ignavibacteria bacterium]
MGKYTAIKNALVLTLDEKSRVGRFTIIIKDDQICNIDYEGELIKDAAIVSRYPGAIIIDASNKIICPAFVNPYRKSFYSYIRSFLKNTTYSNVEDNISVALLENYFSGTSINNRLELRNILTLGFYESFLRGELLINEVIPFLKKDFIADNYKKNFYALQELILSIGDNNSLQLLQSLEKPAIFTVGDETLLSNYSLSFLKKSLIDKKINVLFEIMQQPSSYEKLKSVYDKSFIKILAENNILGSQTFFANPLFFHLDDIELVLHKDAYIILSPSDIFMFSDKKFDFDYFLKYNANFVIGTGINGVDLISELRLLSRILQKSNFTYERLIRMITTVPSKMFGVVGNINTIKTGGEANLLFFDLGDPRNIINLPEINTEQISEHIIEKLSTKDISDIMFKGKFWLRDYICEVFNPSTILNINAKSFRKILEVGKYFEFQDRTMMHKRVGDLEPKRIDKKIEEDAEQKSYYLEEGQPIESDFRIVGTAPAKKPYEYFTEPESSDYDNIIIYELDSLYNGIIVAGKSSDFIAQSDNTFITIEEKEIELPEPKKEPIDDKSSRKIIFRKEKLRFGFDEDNPQSD